ncbi:MAG: hypothetical protein HRU38_13855 [Saccharospirillaceae bacterium]|nr:hypothetical protein [Pseudomonadales bacterium]NRB79730.1 hypothetical protein [Saccharospirillaceae bacterium]
MSIENILNVGQISLDTTMLQHKLNALNIANVNNSNASSLSLDFKAVLNEANIILNSQGLKSAESFLQKNTFIKENTEKENLADIMAETSEILLRYKAVSQSTGQMLNLYQIAINGGR